MKTRKITKIFGTNREVRVLFAASVILCLTSFATLIVAVQIAQTTSSQAVTTPITGFQTETPITQGLVTTRISNVRYNNSAQPFTAPANKEYIIVNLEVINRGDAPVQVLPSSDTYIKDDKGNVVYLTPLTLDNPFRAGELLPGEQIKGDLSYLVPKDSGLKLYIDAKWSGGVIPITIK